MIAFAEYLSVYSVPKKKWDCHQSSQTVIRTTIPKWDKTNTPHDNTASNNNRHNYGNNDRITYNTQIKCDCIQISSLDDSSSSGILCMRSKIKRVNYLWTGFAHYISLAMHTPTLIAVMKIIFTFTPICCCCCCLFVNNCLLPLVDMHRSLCSMAVFAYEYIVSH